MNGFLSKLEGCVQRNESILCVGLDPDPEYLPAAYRRDAGGVFEFNKLVIEATSDLVCAYKPNVAFYEAIGLEGMRALERTRRLIPEYIPTIADAKRGDIPNTARFYARAVFDVLEFDSVTVSPYMGMDSMEPFLEREDRGVWVLGKTSNPGSADLQSLTVEGRGHSLYLEVLYQLQASRSKADVGFVVGATNPGDLDRVREHAPDIPLLIPGIGTQAGDLHAVARASQSGIVVVNSSRSILYGNDGTNLAEAIRERALLTRGRLNAARERLQTMVAE